MNIYYGDINTQPRAYNVTQTWPTLWEHQHLCPTLNSGDTNTQAQP